jgi:beta-lactamase regulating signal transducer with metallopeptidase domain
MMTQLVSMSSPVWGALRLMLVHTLWQGPVVLLVAFLGDKLTRTRPQAAFAMSFRGLLFMPALALATYYGAVAYLSDKVVAFSSTQTAIDREVPVLPWSHWANVAVVGSWASLAALLIVRSVLAECYLRSRLLRRSRDLDASWRERVFAMSTSLGLKPNIRIIMTRDEPVPLAFGWLRPIVAFPEGLLVRAPTDHIELLLLHELMHLRRRDYPVMLVQHFVRCLFFYNPAVWCLLKLMNQHRELACDRDVLNWGVERRRYAEALVGLEGLRHEVMGVSAGGGDLLWRVRAILDVPQPAGAKARSRWATALGLATIGFAAVACAGREPGASNDYSEVFTVELFEDATALATGTPILNDTEIPLQASHADQNGRALIRAHDNVEVDRVISVLESLKQEGWTRVAFARVGRDDSTTVP